VTDQPKDVVQGLWKALAARDWDSIPAFIAEDCIYYDVPAGAAFAARGPADIVKRLQLGLAGLAGYTNYDGRLVAEGDTVMYEHSERWEWTSGETVLLPFVTVHTLRDSRITLWADYWDYRTLLDVAPAAWQESLMLADTSWSFDATGLV
jgi:limonene-1,2-epoxide hydrolase